MDSCPSESTGLYHYLVQHHQMTAYSKLYPSFLNSQGRQHAELIIFNFCIGYRCGGIVVVAVIYCIICCVAAVCIQVYLQHVIKDKYLIRIVFCG